MSTSTITANDVDVDELERGLLTAITQEHWEAIEASVTGAAAAVDRLLPHLHAVVDQLGGSSTLVGTEHACKTPRSLARAFAAEFRMEQMAVADFLARTKDRVRFAIQIPEYRYVKTVCAALAAFRQRGFEVERIVNFWGRGGRHNGLNVTLRDESGFRFEVQFPTELSWEVSRETHHAYEVLRLRNAPYAARVDAFIAMLAVNKVKAMAVHQPVGIQEFEADKSVDSTFMAWVSAERRLWERYLLELAEERVPFDRILDRHALASVDVFPSSRSE